MRLTLEGFHSLALRQMLTKYFYNFIDKRLIHLVLALFEKGESTILLKVFQFIEVKMTEFVEEPEKWLTERHYERIKEHFAKMSWNDLLKKTISFM